MPTQVVDGARVERVAGVVVVAACGRGACCHSRTGGAGTEAAIVSIDVGWVAEMLTNAGSPEESTHPAVPTRVVANINGRSAIPVTRKGLLSFQTLSSSAS